MNKFKRQNMSNVSIHLARLSVAGKEVVLYLVARNTLYIKIFYPQEVFPSIGGGGGILFLKHGQRSVLEIFQDAKVLNM